MTSWEKHLPTLGEASEDGECDITHCACWARPPADQYGRYWFATHLADLGAPDYMVEYWRFWSSIVEPTGKGLDRDAVARELSDYRVVMGEASKVYEELAGFSKPNTAAVHVIARAEEQSAENHANLILCDLLPNIYDEVARHAVREYAESLHEGAWEEFQRGEKVREEIRTAKAAEG